MRENGSNSGKFWSDTRMFLLGIRVSWVAVLLGNILWIRRGSRLAELLLVDCPIGKRPK
jgi:hypothetical protein